MVKLKRVGHVVLGVGDLPRSITFYTGVLGTELLNVLEERPTTFSPRA